MITVTTGIPTLDLEDFKAGTIEQRIAFVTQLGRTYEEIGFVAIKNHGLDADLQHKLYDVVQRFFALPEEVKMKYDGSAVAGQRGYTGKGKEHAKNSNVGDLKEFFHVGQEPSPDCPNEVPNIWPEEIPEFKAITTEAFQKLEQAGKEMLEALAIYLSLPEDYFEDKVYKGSSILRPIHYFPIDDPDSVPPNAVRSAEHEDINLITLLMGASTSGLEVLNRSNEWVPITAVPECIVVNVGDMLQRLTNNLLRSTTHRVVNPPRELMNTSRFSIPFFMHPRAEMDLTCLDSCIDAEHPKAYEPITAGEYLSERLREIGLLK